MSRSALWRQEGNQKVRQQQAEELYELACEEGKSQGSGRSNSTHIVPLWGPDNNTFHLPSLLLQHIIHSAYFQKDCLTLLNWQSIIDEIYMSVTHVKPYQQIQTYTPSKAFCLLLRLCTLRLTIHQMELTISHPDSPYIRAIGFLYLRFVGLPNEIMKWISPYLLDSTEFNPDGDTSTGTTSSSTTTTATTMGEYIRQLYKDRDYYGIPLPRYPLQLEQELHVQIQQSNTIWKRAQEHYQNKNHMQYFTTIGNSVMALYSDADNPIRWYPAVIDRIISRAEQDTSSATTIHTSTGSSSISSELYHPKFVVTFTEYGNTETVHLGELDVLNGNWQRQHAETTTGTTTLKGNYDNNESKNGGSYESSSSKRYYARRPPTTKASLSSQPVITNQNKQRYDHGNDHRADDGGGSSISRGYATRRDAHSDTTYSRRTDHPQHQRPMGHQDGHQQSSSQQQEQARKRSPEVMMAIADKKRKLMAKYG